MRQDRGVRLVKRGLVGVLVLLLVAAGGAWWWLRASLPVLDGEMRLPGLHAPAEVIFDGHGVPHVYAVGVEDAWFMAGVLHARDRLWQMELYRRAAYGRLSEILGPQTLPIDRRFLTLDLRAAAQTEWNGAGPAVRDALTRYAEGVNAHLAQAPGRRRPLELQLLGVTPAEWSPIDSLAVGRLLAWRLAENHQAELVRYALAARFGSTEAFRLMGRYPADAPSVVQGGSRANAAPSGEAAPPASEASGPSRGEAAALSAREARRLSRREAAALPGRVAAGLDFLHPAARRGGSNNWVIDGRRTSSGRPLLANDPHLQLEFPGIWYELHLVALGLDVIGVSVPGTPFVIIGHNARVAWGVTNTGADVQDLYAERFDLSRRRYLFAGEWLPAQVTAHQIPVRDSEPRAFETWRTRHGTVFAESGLLAEDAPSWLTPSAGRRGEARAFTLRWDAGGEMAAAFEAINRAGSWGEFTAAVERFSAPSQNFVYADVDGNIGYLMSGVLPLRNGTVGVMPSDGTSGEGGWVGSVPSTALPRLLNPPRGYITSSNNLIDRAWPGLITRDWAAPFRTTRLHQLIDQSPKVDMASAAEWQNDVAGLAAAPILAHAESARVLAEQQKNTGAAGLLAELRDWDRRIDGRETVTRFHLFEQALWRRTFADEMGDELFNHFFEWAGAERQAGLYEIVDTASSPWFDDIATLGQRETRDEIFVLAASDAVRRFRTEFATAARWDQRHAASFAHPLGSAAAPLRWLFNRGPVPLTGNAYTVNRTSFHRLESFAAWEIPSWRQLFDVGRWDDSRVIIPGGQSGHPLSPHYFDQSEIWRAGQYRVQPFSRAAVSAAAAHRLLATP